MTGKLPEGVIWRTINGARVAISPGTGKVLAGAGGKLTGRMLNWYDDMGPMPSFGAAKASGPAVVSQRIDDALEKYPDGKIPVSDSSILGYEGDIADVLAEAESKLGKLKALDSALHQYIATAEGRTTINKITDDMVKRARDPFIEAADKAGLSPEAVKKIVAEADRFAALTRAQDDLWRKTLLGYNHPASTLQMYMKGDGPSVTGGRVKKVTKAWDAALKAYDAGDIEGAEAVLAKAFRGRYGADRAKSVVKKIALQRDQMQQFVDDANTYVAGVDAITYPTMRNPKARPGADYLRFRAQTFDTLTAVYRANSIEKVVLSKATEDGYFDLNQIAGMGKSIRPDHSAKHGTPGGHWGSASFDNPTAAGAAFMTAPAFRPIDRDLAKATPVLSNTQKILAGMRHRYAQQRVAETSRDDHPVLVRGTTLSQAVVSKLVKGEQDTVVLTGSTAFTFEPNVAAHYATSAWSNTVGTAAHRSTKGYRRAAVVFEMRRNDAVDRSLSMWHENTDSIAQKQARGSDAAVNSPAFEVLSGLGEIRIVGSRVQGTGKNKVTIFEVEPA